MPVEVVLPWAPATETSRCRAMSQCSACERCSTGMPRSCAPEYSGLSGHSAPVYDDRVGVAEVGCVVPDRDRGAQVAQRLQCWDSSSRSEPVTGMPGVEEHVARCRSSRSRRCRRSAPCRGLSGTATLRSGLIVTSSNPRRAAMRSARRRARSTRSDHPVGCRRARRRRGHARGHVGDRARGSAAAARARRRPTRA